MVDHRDFDSRYLVGNDRVDLDHRHLFGLLCDLGQAVECGELGIAKAYVAEVVGSFRDHFAREELLLEQWSVPGTGGHRAHHRALMHAIGDVWGEVAELASAEVLARARHRLADIFRAEVLDADAAIARHCAAASVALADSSPEAWRSA